jgi:hypothetical protein
MPKKEFIMRGQTASGETEVLQFGGRTSENRGYAYMLTQFDLYPSTAVPASSYELTGTVTAAPTAETPTDPNFNNDGLIATAFTKSENNVAYPLTYLSIVNDLFLITQDLILMVQDTGSAPINWQCRFVSVKMSGPEEAATNYKQFAISDG